MSQRIIALPRKNLIGLHFFVASFPVVIGTYSESDEYKVSFLKDKKLSTLEYCRWAKNHNMQHQVIYDARRKNILQHPLQYLQYKKLLRDLC